MVVINFFGLENRIRRRKTNKNKKKKKKKKKKKDSNKELFILQVTKVSVTFQMRTDFFDVRSKFLVNVGFSLGRKSKECVMLRLKIDRS